MTKQCPDITMDAFLGYIADCDCMVICSQEPTSYTDAYTTHMLVRQVMIPGDNNGDFTIADDVSGRKLTMSQKLAAAITNSGTATHVALVKTGDSTLRYITTNTSQVITAGGTVDFPSWKINIADPS